MSLSCATSLRRVGGPWEAAWLSLQEVCDDVQGTCLLWIRAW